MALFISDICDKKFVESSLRRTCSKCGKSISYSRKDAFKRAENKNRCCLACSVSGEFNGFYGKIHTCESKKKNSEWHKGRKTSEIHKLNTSKNNARYWTGKNRDNDTKYKLRIAKINDLNKKNVLLGKNGARNFNLKACEFIDQLNREKGWNLQHALNGGEIELYGYFVDGYDKERNIIFEYDEKRHKYTKEKDLIRQNILLNKINPTIFLRYDEVNDILYDFKIKSAVLL